MKIWAVEKDTGVLHEFRDDFAVLLNPRGARTALGLELPLVVGQTFGGLFYPLLVLLVGEVRAVTAAALHEFGRWLGEDPLTPGTKDARPVTFEEGDVEHPRAKPFVVLETDPLVGVRRYQGHDEKVTWCVRPRRTHLQW